MSTEDLTLRIVSEIRNEVRATREDLHTTREELHQRIDKVERRLDGRIDGLEQRFDALEQRVDRRITESEIRTITEIHAVAGQLQDIKDLFRDRLDLRDRVTHCERDIDELKHRAG